MRLLRHPGPASRARHHVATAHPAAQHVLHLPKGCDLMRALGAWLDDGSAPARRPCGLAAVILGGRLESARYMTGREDPEGVRAAWYHGPHDAIGPLTLLGGNMLVGRDDHGDPFVHCHAVLADTAGQVFGGHLLPDACPVGGGGCRLFVTLHQGGEFVLAEDPETGFTIFHPSSRPVGDDQVSAARDRP